MNIKDDRLKSLLEEIETFQNRQDINYELLYKIDGELTPGSKAKIYFNDRDSPDVGYIFVLPHQDCTELDACVHLPEIDNSDGMDKGSEIYIHIYNILELDRVERIELYNN